MKKILLMTLFMMMSHAAYSKEQHKLTIFGTIGTGYPSYFNYGGGIGYTYYIDKIQAITLETMFNGITDLNLNAVGSKIPFNWNTLISYSLGFKKELYRVYFDIIGIGYSYVYYQRNIENYYLYLHKHGIVINFLSMHLTYKNGIYTSWRHNFTYFGDFSISGNLPYSKTGSERYEYKTYLAIGYQFNLN